MQVFASGVDAHIKFALAQDNHALVQHEQLQQQSQFLDIADVMAYQKSMSEDCCSFGDDEDSGELNLHADLSDEPVPALGFNFRPNSSPLAAAHGNDGMREPPFLPLISPPPRA
ncbi:hypothetical protein ACXX82_08210 [Glaciimonas sp. GNP009]